MLPYKVLMVARPSIVEYKYSALGILTLTKELFVHIVHFTLRDCVHSVHSNNLKVSSDPTVENIHIIAFLLFKIYWIITIIKSPFSRLFSHSSMVFKCKVETNCKMFVYLLKLFVQ